MDHCFKFFLSIFFLVSVVTCMQSLTKEKKKHEQEIAEWHSKRITSLKREYGWLSLVALDWLNDGANEIKNIGTITLKDSTVSIKIGDGISATMNGKSFSSGVLKSDNDKNGPDTIKIGSRAFVIIKRGAKYAIRMWDKDKEERKTFTDIERYPVSDKWKITAKWEAYNPQKKIIVPTIISGYEEEYPVPGAAVFTIDGKEYKLEPVIEEEGGDYFYIFSDKTNGSETYGSGRFLYSKREENGMITIDFNKAYNPPCAFTPYATCPLPPKTNRLPIRIDAGEKKYGKH